MQYQQQSIKVKLQKENHEKSAAIMDKVKNYSIK